MVTLGALHSSAITLFFLLKCFFEKSCSVMTGHIKGDTLLWHSLNWGSGGSVSHQLIIRSAFRFPASPLHASICYWTVRECIEVVVIAVAGCGEGMVCPCIPVLQIVIVWIGDYVYSKKKRKKNIKKYNSGILKYSNNHQAFSLVFNGWEFQF